jgi:hypothetical protein
MKKLLFLTFIIALLSSCSSNSGLPNDNLNPTRFLGNYKGTLTAEGKTANVTASITKKNDEGIFLMLMRGSNGAEFSFDCAEDDKIKNGFNCIRLATITILEGVHTGNAWEGIFSEAGTGDFIEGTFSFTKN